MTSTLTVISSRGVIFFIGLRLLGTSKCCIRITSIKQKLMDTQFFNMSEKIITFFDLITFSYIYLFQFSVKRVQFQRQCKAH